jgi:hypothetical protein
MQFFGAAILGGMLAAAGSGQDMAAAVELPDKAREAVEKRWTGAAPAGLPAEPAACLQDGAAATSLLTADLDSDGHADYIVPVRTAAGLRLAVVLYRLPDYAVFELDELDGPEAPVAIGLAPRGAQFMPSGGIPDFYPAPTVLGRRCGQPDIAYLWTGFSFRKTPLSVGTAPVPPSR